MSGVLITIDVEGDNVWARPRQVETKNAAFLPRFQALCERYRMRPTYLTNHEMALEPVFREFASDVLRRDAGEIGMHLHAWDTPPIEPLTADDTRYLPYLTDYPEPVLRAKVRHMTDLLEQTFGRKMLSHRAGRWSFDPTYARALIECGYVVDCSVTPHVSWRRVPGAPNGNGGADYTTAPEDPYFVNLADIRRPGTSCLLEVPMTVIARPSPPPALLTHTAQLFGRFATAAVNRLLPATVWLRPNGRNLRALVDVLKVKHAEGAEHVEFMLHSSELMPGGSPTFPTPRSIETLFDHIEQVFVAARWYLPQTLTEFHAAHAASHTDT